MKNKVKILSSQLNPHLEWGETQEVHPADQDAVMKLFKIQLFRLPPVKIMVGTKHHYREQHAPETFPSVQYYFVYLITNQQSVVRIGVVEFEDKYGGSNPEPDWRHMTPILFTFVSPEFIQIHTADSDIGKDGNDAEDFRGNSLSGGGSIGGSGGIKSKPGKRDSIPKYYERTTDTWLQKYMRNQQYQMDDTLPPATFLQICTEAFHMPEEELRAQIANEFTQTLFDEYQSRHQFIKKELDDIRTETAQMKELTDANRRELEETPGHVQPIVREAIYKQAVELKTRHTRLKRRHTYLKQMMKPLAFMSKMKTVADVQTYIRQSPAFVADAWAIAVIERIHLTYFVFFSRAAYNSKCYENVVITSHIAPDPVLAARGTFHPTRFVMLADETQTVTVGSVFKRVVYGENISAPTTIDRVLPPDLEDILRNKAVESASDTTLSLIDWTQYERSTSTNKRKTKIKTATAPEKAFSEKAFRHLLPLFYLSEKYTMPVFPGRAEGESIAFRRELDYVDLMTSAPKWRQILSKESTAHPFVLDGYTWPSILHYVQANHFTKSRETYTSFAVESKSPLSKSAQLAKYMTKPSGNVKGVQIRPADIVVEKIEDDALNALVVAAINAKGAQCPEWKSVLLLTRDAQLAQHKRGHAPTLDTPLMTARNEWLIIENNM